MGRDRGAAATLSTLLFGPMCSFRFDKAWNLRIYCSTKKRRFARCKFLLVMPATIKCREWTVIFCFEARKGIYACNNWRRRLNYLMMLQLRRGRTDNGLTWWLQPTTTWKRCLENSPKRRGRKRCASKVVFALQVDSNIRIRQRNVIDRGVYVGKRLIYHTILPTDKLYRRLSITRTFKGNRKMFAELSGARIK